MFLTYYQNSKSFGSVLRYGCRHLEKCRFEKNAVKDSSTILQYTSNKSHLQLISYSRVIKYAFFFLVKFFQVIRSFLRQELRFLLYCAPLSIKAYSVTSFSNLALRLWEYIFDMPNYKCKKKIDFSDRLKSGDLLICGNKKNYYLPFYQKKKKL